MLRTLLMYAHLHQLSDIAVKMAVLAVTLNAKDEDEHPEDEHPEDDITLEEQTARWSDATAYLTALCFIVLNIRILACVHHLECHVSFVESPQNCSSGHQLNPLCPHSLVDRVAFGSGVLFESSTLIVHHCTGASRTGVNSSSVRFGNVPSKGPTSWTLMRPILLRND